jgi:hypothetical protein
LLKKLVSDWRSKVDGTIEPAQRKAFLYAGHDSTIVNILSALKVWDPQMPDYGITVLLELSRDKITNEYGVDVFLRNSTTTAPPPIDAAGVRRVLPLVQTGGAYERRNSRGLGQGVRERRPELHAAPAKRTLTETLSYKLFLLKKGVK